METTALGPPVSLCPATLMRVPLRGCGQAGPSGGHAHRPVQVAPSRGRGSAWTAQPTADAQTAWERQQRCGAATMRYHAQDPPLVSLLVTRCLPTLVLQMPFSSISECLFSLKVSGAHGPSALVSVEVAEGLVHAAVTSPSVKWLRRTATPSRAHLSQLWKVGGRGLREGGRVEPVREERGSTWVGWSLADSTVKI